MLLMVLVSKAQYTQYYFLDWQWQNNSPALNLTDSHILKFDFLLETYSTDFDVKLENAVYVKCDSNEIAFLEFKDVSSEICLDYHYGIERKHLKIKGELFPFRLNNGRYEKLLFCNISVYMVNDLITKRATSAIDHSVLSTGKWYKIAVNETGIHQISYQDFVDLGIDIDNINPNNIRIFGHPGGMLPLHNSESRVKDLKELSIQVVGQNDNSFDSDDVVLFYGQSPHQWIFETSQFKWQEHYFDDYTYYFITTDLGQGQRISSTPQQSSSDTLITTFDDYRIYENNEVNFVKSGREWYGDKFDLVDTRNYNFSIPHLIGSVSLKAVLAARATSPYTSTFRISSSGMSPQDYTISPVTGNYNYANLSTVENDFSPNADNFNVEIEFSSNSSTSKGWVDYVQINAQRALKMSDNQLSFRSINSVHPSSKSTFELSNASSSVTIWDVTHPLEPQRLITDIEGTTLSFSVSTDTLREFIAFNGGYKSVTLSGQVPNQDLHGLRGVDYIIVSHPLFLSEAQRLADFHRTHSGLTVEVVTPQQIYNEFSSGSQDVSAIRDFAKMLYEQEHSLKYLLLLGDASYDPKNRVTNNSNFIVSYQSENSTNSLYSYVSDDFFAILDQGESISQNDEQTPFLDIGVGRFPVQTPEEAQNMVDKVIAYNSENAFGDWRLNMCFVGDDNDVIETVHSSQAEELADYVKSTYPFVNVDKIYLDAYEQITSTGGQRCPSVNSAISDVVNRGMFFINYTGHGGELGWAHERILEINDIYSWTNDSRFPLFMTATCEFGRYDDPARISAGEHLFLRENSGAIALLTTSRVVFTNSNLNLNNALLQNLFPKSTDSIFPRLGDVLMRTKNTVTNVENSNHRNFTLLGDPAITLSYPRFDIKLTNVQDSAKALGKVTVYGEVQHNGAKLNDFNGYVFPKVFDKRKDYQTLGQDQSPVLLFDLQKNVIFNGMSSVENGAFSFTFIVPKDIDYDYGNGKISLYALGDRNGVTYDASGYNTQLIIGGTSNNYGDDYTGPDIELFMNDTNFIAGGLTNANPNLFARLFDQNGINTVGNGIGHDMVAILDESSTSPIVLNDFFQYEANSYQRGTITYPFSNLEDGHHQLTVKVWDVYNNFSESHTDFTVVNSSQLTIQNLMNYPNPVVDFTSFYFEHNKAQEDLNVTLEIFDTQGNMVVSIQDQLKPQGFRYGPLTWNGTSSSGANLPPGMYIYRIVAQATDGMLSSTSAKLILIN